MFARCLRAKYVGLALGLAVMLGCFPAGAEAKMVGSAASGEQGLSPRQAREAQVVRLLAEEKVAQALRQAHLTPDQVRERLDRLNDAQLSQLADQLETVKAGQGAVLVLALVAVILTGMLLYMTIEAA
ncbi:MAG TPA: PA2779 family protein [Planctomycetota bacterium]|nr:PA2779 family protein [Planctomycetota bacterium]HRR79536.1 PA2779 family protein [Planctomycetota bacterium]HRT96144.1 PA2779 family protein [Planctomycetota bacterium]